MSDTRYDVYGLGNAIVDTEFQVTDAIIEACQLPKGVMTLVDDERKRELATTLSKDTSAVKRSGGGSAANTIVAVAQFGGAGFYSCKVATDDTGDFFLSDLAEAGVATNAAGRRVDGLSGECLSLITPDAERTMTTCLGVSADLTPDEIDAGSLAASRYLYLEGYLASGDGSRDALFAAQSIAREHGTQVALTLSDPAMVDHFRDVFDTLVERGVDLMLCNEDEARLWTQASSTERAIDAVAARCDAWVVTMGPAGAVVYDGERRVHVPGAPAKAIDTTGAGDMFAGAFLWALTRGADFETAATLANRAAATVVSNFGARLTADVFSRELKELALTIG